MNSNNIDNSFKNFDLKETIVIGLKEYIDMRNRKEIRNLLKVGEHFLYFTLGTHACGNKNKLFFGVNISEYIFGNLTMIRLASYGKEKRFRNVSHLGYNNGWEIMKYVFDKNDITYRIYVNGK